LIDFTFARMLFRAPYFMGLVLLGWGDPAFGRRSAATAG
jgi:hypothetical protein